MNKKLEDYGSLNELLDEIPENELYVGRIIKIIEPREILGGYIVMEYTVTDRDIKEYEKYCYQRILSKI